MAGVMTTSIKGWIEAFFVSAAVTGSDLMVEGTGNGEGVADRGEVAHALLMMAV